MKKFVTFVLVLSLGLFCAIGCQKKTDKKPDTKAPAAGAAGETKPAGEATPPAAGEAKPAGEAEKPK